MLNICKLIIFSIWCSSAYAINFSDWKNLNLEDQSEYVSDEFFDESNIVHFSFNVKEQQIAIPTASKDYISDELSKKIHALSSNIYTEIDGRDYYAIVGSLSYWYNVYFIQGTKELVAVSRYVKQIGCMSEDQDNIGEFGYMYFDNMVMANSAGCFDNDVAWTGSEHFNHEFSTLSSISIDYMEWTGH